MFTGIVEQIGTVVARDPRGPGARFVIACTWADLEMGESIAVSGVCLTVDGIRKRGGEHLFEADASLETLDRTTLQHARPGKRVNLERALRPTSRLGGHFVSGHVDARGRLVSRAPVGEATQLKFSMPKDVAPFVAHKGSIAIDGISLTVNELRDTSDGAEFDVVIIPHTLRATTLDGLAVGDFVNLEIDVLARYVARMLPFAGNLRAAAEGSPSHDAQQPSGDDALLRALRGSGYL